MAVPVQAMELLAEIDHPGVIVHLDSYHMNIEENSAREAVQVCGDKLGYVSETSTYTLAMKKRKLSLAFTLNSLLL